MRRQPSGLQSRVPVTPRMWKRFTGNTNDLKVSRRVLNRRVSSERRAYLSAGERRLSSFAGRCFEPPGHAEGQLALDNQSRWVMVANISLLRELN
jgi:hypothetical protein